jgi:hypothetical protein
MKIAFSKIVLIVFAAVPLLTFSNACKKETDKMIPPDIEFKTGTGYTSSDAAVAISTPIKVGIHAEKTEGDDYLNIFTVSHSFDGVLPVVTDSTRLLDESEHDVFDEDINFTTRGVAGTEVYNFTITNRDGLVVTKTLTLTVN